LLPLTEFHKRTANKITGLQSYCRQCRSQAHQMWQERNPGYMTQYAKRWQEQNKEWKARTKKEWLEQNKERGAAYHKAYIRSPKGKVANARKTHKRRALVKNVSAPMTIELWKKMLMEYDFRCYLCGRQFDDRELVMEHVRPLSRRGTNDYWNIRPACQPCNAKKGSRLPEEIQRAQT
jgi:5-methylcytosine-specific restriction endonuclease McrA